MGIRIPAIRSSFELVKPFFNEFADRFYENLLRDYPDAKPIFAEVDVHKQKTCLIDTLVATVENLDNPDAMTPLLLTLGERYIRYGAEDIHVHWLGASLLKTFGDFLGAHWTDDLHAQWTIAYKILAEAVQAGAKNAPKSAPKLRSVHAPKDRTLTMIHEQEKIQELTKGIAAGLSLPESLKAQIHRSVETIVVALVKAEVQNCYKEQLLRIERMSAEDLVRLAM